MNKFVMMLVAIMVTLFASNALAYDPPTPPAKGWYVVDTSGKMTASQIQKLNLKIDQVSKTTKNEFAILLLSDMGGDNIEDVANSTFKKWGVGKRGLDNGCLIVVALKERKSRIETGKGVEGEVTDLQSNDILKKHLNPHLKSGDFYGGFDETLGALSSLIESRHAQKADPAPTTAPLPASNPVTSQPTTSTNTTPRASGGCNAAATGTSESSSFWPMIGMFGIIGVGAWLVARSAKRKKREAEEAERKIERERLMRLTLANKQRDAEEAFRLRREREKSLQVTTPSTPPPVVATPSVPPPAKPAVPRPTPKKQASIPPVVKKQDSVPPAIAAASAVAAMASAQALQDKLRREREARESREAEERRAEARRRQERDEEDRRRRQREDDDARSSSSSSSSSFDWGSSSSSSDDSDSGGGFGGGDSGGGGSSSDW